MSWPAAVDQAGSAAVGSATAECVILDNPSAKLADKKHRLFRFEITSAADSARGGVPATFSSAFRLFWHADHADCQY
jgi:hypothetical protein